MSFFGINSGSGSGGSQTPWTSNINGGGFNLTNVNSLTVNTLEALTTVTTGDNIIVLDDQITSTPYAGNSGLIVTRGTSPNAQIYWNETTGTWQYGVVGSMINLPSLLTQGSVVFAGVSGVYTQDNTNFFWQDSTPSLQLGPRLSNPIDATFEVYSTSASIPLAHFHCTASQSSTAGSQVALVAAPTAAMLNGSQLGVLEFGGSVSSTQIPGYGARIQSYATSNWSFTDHSSNLVFATVPVGSTSVLTALTLNPDQSALFAGSISATNLSGSNSGDITLKVFPYPTNGLSLVGQQLSLGTASASTTGALTYTDWNTFNSKGSGNGTVTSVTFTGDGTVLSSTPTSAVTSSGTLAASLNTQARNLVLAGPSSGSAATPTFRSLVAGDIPALSYQALNTPLDPASVIFTKEDFLFNGYWAPETTIWGESGTWATNLAGSAGAKLKGTSQTAVVPDGIHSGIIEITVTSVSDGASILGGYPTGNEESNIILGSSAWTIDFIFNLYQLSNSTDRFNFSIGLCTAAIYNASPNRVALNYSDNINSGHWSLITYAASVVTSVDSGVNATTGWHHGRITVNAAASSVSLYIDNLTTPIATSTTNIPSGISQALSLGYSMTKQVGTNAVYTGLDYISILGSVSR